MPTRQNVRPWNPGSVLIGLRDGALDPTVSRIEGLYRAGRTREALSLCETLDTKLFEPSDIVRVSILRGMALFDLGNCIDGVSQLVEAERSSRIADPDLQFAAAFALFVRQADFQTPEETLLGLSRLRQLATIAGDAQSLAGLHFAVARFEGYRGLASDAHRHLEIARRFADRDGQLPIRCTLEVVAVSLAFMAGDLRRAHTLAEVSLSDARKAGFKKYVLASQANLAAVSLCLGDPRRASNLANEVLEASGELPFLRLGVLDTLSQVSLFEGDQANLRRFLAECASTIATQRFPARSWYELAHQLTRCACFEHFEDWSQVLALTDDIEPDLARRQFRTLRTLLLCAKARALSRLGKHSESELTLANAVRTCPRGAVDLLIVLEASHGLCMAVSGDWAGGAIHLDRATAACRAIGHRYYEAWIDRSKKALLAQSGSMTVPELAADTTRAPLIVSDISALLGAGNSVDLLSQRLTAVLDQTALASRTEVEAESGRSYRAETSAEYHAGPDGRCSLTLRGGDRRIVINIRDVRSLDDITAVKHLVDLVQMAIRRGAGGDLDDAQQNLWPEVTPSIGDDTIFQSPRMVELLRVAMRLASADLPILITGETGTGKEVLARFIHGASKVARGPFIAFNCSATPRDLVESQLFGHRRGAFTGAIDTFPGVIQAAERGTLFLDEIGDLETAVQPKLLRFLESNEVHPVGDTKPHPVHVRIVAATNADLDELVAQNRFRRDLFYRIGVARVALPPLRERKDEIPALAALFLDRYSRDCQRRSLHLGDDFIAALLLYDWPGNIRQLANEIRRVVAMSVDGETLRSTALMPEIAKSWRVRPVVSEEDPLTVSIRLDQNLEQAVGELERRFIEHALATAGGRVTDAAQLLGLSRKGLFLKRKRQGLTRR